MDDVDVHINGSGLAELTHELWVRDMLLERGDIVAATARSIAPRQASGSHGGAESIHASTGQDVHGYYVEVSWDIIHRYMRYPEAGTKYQRAQKFMERALEIVMGGIR